MHGALVSLDVYLYECELCEGCGLERRGAQLFWANITHNLRDMAMEAGIYGVVWRPEENGVEIAADLVEPLRDAVADMRARREHYEKFNAANGWGTYENFVPWLQRYLEACERHLGATVEASR